MKPALLFSALVFCGCTSSSSVNNTAADAGGDRSQSDVIDLHKPSGTHVIRRLSVHELSLTLNELTGLSPTALSLIPPDSKGFTFDRIVSSQTMSRSHFDAFMEVANEVSRDLLAAKTLDQVGSKCSAMILPPSAPQKLKKVLGSSFGSGPDWAIVSDPKELHVLYSPIVEASYSHNFVAAGKYKISLYGRSNTTISTIEASINSDIVNTYTNIDGSFNIDFELDVENSDPTLIKYIFDSNGNDNFDLFVNRLEIDGPIDPNKGKFVTERRDCALSIIDELGEQAFRRPLSEEEKGRFVGLYDDNITEVGFPASVEMILQSILANPKFLYLIEHGTMEGEGRYQLNDWEIASRLSYAICENSPDQELRKAARDGKLRDKATRTAQIKRLFGKPCAEKTIARFFEQWLWLDRLNSLNKDNIVFPIFSNELRAGMLLEEKKFLDELFWKQNAKLTELYTSNVAWPHPQSAVLYGLKNVTEQTKVTLGKERAGILTHPGFLAVTGRFSDTSPVRRGVFVLEQVFCQEPRPVPMGLDITPPAPDPSLTTRERWAAHSSSDACAGCHLDMDPIGFAFEGFDSIGMYRTMENGRPVDTKGGAPTIGIADGEIEGAAELSKAIASSPIVASCFAKQWLRFSLGRLDHDEDPIDISAVEKMRDALETKSMKEAMMGLLESEVMEYRVEKEGGQ